MEPCHTFSTEAGRREGRTDKGLITRLDVRMAWKVEGVLLENWIGHCQKE